MWNNPINLVEHHLRLGLELTKDQIAGLNQYLDTVWETRSLFYDEDPETPLSVKQPFLEFVYDPVSGQPSLKAGKYVGFIQYEGLTIQIIPKLFDKDQADLAFRHLLWWMDYSQRVRFPFADLLTGSEFISNFPEALIRYFARFAYQLVSTSPYHKYEEITDTMPYLRGRLNTQAYVNNSLSQGNWHQLVCDYEPFLFNNRLNQIIKFVARRLTHLCQQKDTHRDLDKIVFLLDEVDDLPCTAQDCDTVLVSRFFQEYDHCLDMCRFFLTDQYSNRKDDQQRHFCFLVPMDLIYEDFITGIVKTHLGNRFTVTSQAVNYLAATHPTGNKVFKIKNDILLTDKANKAVTVVDTKYKVRKYESADNKAGISQTDLYQMVSYGLRQNSRDVLLLYPLAHYEASRSVQEFTVTSALLANQPIHIRAVDLTLTGESQQAIVDTLLPQLTAAFNLPTNS
ncbi:McrC family protein [Fibrella forsythiae]|uniref:5-methylcytosine-specific restriction enzyme subunit McrC n=1 Tax=Fibrella forsythiae TaxID=2817061 RepID=A0ABS3JPU1_9BACT|nr:hypothetical protein [Fibrella forsythiae]MBO0952013.1 hypothetical protein [Fibrella forsythiae]